MPLLLLAVLLAPLLAGCVPGSTRSDGVPTTDAPFTLTALDGGQATFLLDQLDLAPGLALAVLERQGAGYDRPAMDLHGLTTAIERCGCPGTAERLRLLLAR